MFEARIYRGEERIDTRKVEAEDAEEADRKVRESLSHNPQVTYDVEIVYLCEEDE